VSVVIIIDGDVFDDGDNLEILMVVMH